MANDLTQNPWILDTAANTPVKPMGGRTFTTGFTFEDYTGGAASKAILQDSRGKNICTLQGNAAGTPVGEAWFRWQSIEGLVLKQIDSGTVKVIIV